jgi:hypothetical protein
MIISYDSAKLVTQNTISIQYPKAQDLPIIIIYIYIYIKNKTSKLKIKRKNPKKKINNKKSLRLIKKIMRKIYIKKTQKSIHKS